MSRYKMFAFVPLVCLVTACTNTGANYTPIIDGPVGPNYANDLAQCQQLARSQATLDQGTARTALTGAAVAGGATAILDNEGNNVRDAALVGALVGGSASALQNQSNQEAIIRNCMRQRGYRVVN